MEIGKKFSNTSRDINEDGPLDYSDDAFELNDEVINYSDGNAEEQDPSSSGGFKKRSKKEPNFGIFNPAKAKAPKEETDKQRADRMKK